MSSIVKVYDAETKKLKRYETSTGRPLAIVKGKRLVLTELGERLRLKVKDMKLVGRLGLELE